MSINLIFLIWYNLRVFFFVLTLMKDEKKQNFPTPRIIKSCCCIFAKNLLSFFLYLFKSPSMPSLHDIWHFHTTFIDFTFFYLDSIFFYHFYLVTILLLYIFSNQNWKNKTLVKKIFLLFFIWKNPIFPISLPPPWPKSKAK